MSEARFPCYSVDKQAFSPRTREVQFDEKWSFVDKKQKNCDPADPADDHKGDWWDHVAYDPEHRLVLAVVPGARSIENAEEVVAEVKDRTDGASPRLMTSDEYPAYASAIEAAFGVPVARARDRAGSSADPARAPSARGADLRHGPQGAGGGPRRRGRAPAGLRDRARPGARPWRRRR